MQGLTAAQTVLANNLRFLGLVPRAGKRGHFTHTVVSRRELAQVLRLLRAEQRVTPAGAEQGNWVPACNGTEVPFTSRSGRRLLYCWQPSTGRHAYVDTQTDIVLSDDEARAALQTW